MNHSPPLDAFARLESLGYGSRLISVLPPDAEIAPNTSVAIRIAKGDDCRGKAPGLLRRDGLWQGFKDWQNYPTDATDLHRWAAAKANAGVRTGDGLAVIDADALDVEIARKIRAEVEKLALGLPMRVGKMPKAAYVVRIDETGGPCPYMRVAFGEGKRERIEILTKGKQFVAAGKHPSGKDYEWKIPLPPFEELPVVSRADLVAFLERCRAFLPNAEPLHAESGSADAPAQASLTAPIAAVREALAHIKNDGERFETREAYRDIGYAIKAATVDDPAGGLSLFQDWCATWTGGRNEPEIVEADWNRMKPPFRRGAGWLFETAADVSAGAYKPASRWFEQPDLEPAANSDIKPLDTITADMLFDEPPPQRWHVAGWIPHGQTTIMSGDGGTGKTLAALQLAMAGTTGQDWLGLPVQPGPVLFLTAEDEPEELHRRIHAMHKQLGTTPACFAHPLHLISLHGKDAVIATPDAKNPLLLRPTRLMQRLAATMARVRPVLLVLDPQADLFGGKENERIHARQFIGYLQRLAAEYDCAVLLLAHPSMSGMASGSGASGTTAWSNSVRSRLYLSRETSEAGVEPDPNIRILEVKKSNRAVIGSRLVLRYRHGTFGVSEAETADSSLAEAKIVFLRVLNMWAANSEWVTLAQNTKRYAPRAMVAGSEDAAEIGERKLTAAMNAVLEAGLIHQEPFGPPSRLSYRIVSSHPASSEVKNTEFW